MKKFDFYTVQVCVDGFGNDTFIESVWRTKEQAEKHAKEISKGWKIPPEIIGGFFGKELYLAFN